MTYQAIFFGAIGTIVETTEMQRRAFNLAFVEAGVDWYWAPSEYEEMLKKSGGQARIQRFADHLGETVDAAQLHADKVRIFGQLMRSEGLTLRDGVRDVIDSAKNEGMKIGFVTSTGKDQSDAIFEALGDNLNQDEFDYIGDASKIEKSKPAPDIYQDALKELGLSADDVLAIEDTPSSAEAAVAAGIETIGFPGEMTDETAFPRGVHIVKMLTPMVLQDKLLAAE
ncbi:HAD family hydrolase [Yoonia sp. 208BN28-4]|uniref:HAD family hydrolase n=1 Tax=Yoonia sp. 208BN28-4 TaxID=3126505 RepID=UPI0030B35FC2